MQTGIRVNLTLVIILGTMFYAFLICLHMRISLHFSGIYFLHLIVHYVVDIITSAGGKKKWQLSKQ